MWFWMVAAALALAATLGVSLFAARAARRAAAAGEDPRVAVHRRQLAELDELASRGLLGSEERRATQAEAGRRLLSAVDRPAPGWSGGGRESRLAVSVAAAGAAVTALVLYLWLGAPGLPDQPYRARVAAWRAGDPAALAPEQMAAVLQAAVRERPRDPRGFAFLGRAQLASGDPASAALSFAQAARLAPRSADLQAEAGEALVAAAEGKVTPEAATAFRAALARDPANPAARYYLARGRIAAGDVAGGVADWRALAATLSAGDPRRIALEAEIARVARGGPLEAPGPAPAPGGPAQASFIRGMVQSLAARLEAQPDDPEGWARLVRSYGVLGDRPAQQRALARARGLFKTRPGALAQVEAEAR